MALKPCYECGGRVSTMAAACPHCGARVTQPTATSANTANVVAAIASFFVPGLGQLAQGRIGEAILFFVLTVIATALGIAIGLLLLVALGMLAIGVIAALGDGVV